eukprot:4092404-Pyramimonas_sp.AAC.1
MGAVGAWERSHWGLRWSPPYGATKRVRGVPKSVRWAHGNAATGAFAGAPYGATKRMRGVPKWARWAHGSAATGAFAG